MDVRLHVHAPNGSLEEAIGVTFAPTDRDLEQPASWWGHLAELAAHQLELVIDEGRWDLLPVDELPLVRVPFEFVTPRGPSLDIGDDVVPIYTFVIGEPAD